MSKWSQPPGPKYPSLCCATDRQYRGRTESNHALLGEMIFTRPAKWLGVIATQRCYRGSRDLGEQDVHRIPRGGLGGLTPRLAQAQFLADIHAALHP
jgi:hypothetical protein